MGGTIWLKLKICLINRYPIEREWVDMTYECDVSCSNKLNPSIKIFHRVWRYFLDA